jgi:beta-aspartyl-peptidase (threonine type)
VDAVEAAVNVMEDSPLFNAGRGAVFTNQGKNELDASIMDGATHSAGAVASVVGVKNPISAARRVMTETKHVMLVGTGAMAFAKEQGLEFADSAYFFTQERWESLQRAKKEEHSDFGAASPTDDGKFGTAGAVALDANGNIAAGTSTGGLTNKRWGRVGDSPIIGAGTYADNTTCGVSASGVGEYFMRGLLAYDVAAQMRYGKKSLQDAVAGVIHTKLTGMAGADTGGMVALDREGNVAMEFNTSGMYRGIIRGDGVARTYLYEDDEGQVQRP